MSSICLSTTKTTTNITTIKSQCVNVSFRMVDCDHMGWKSWKLIAWTISPTPSLFVAKRQFTYSQGNMGEFWGNEVEYGKSGMLNRSGNISETHTDRGKVTMDGP